MTGFGSGTIDSVSSFVLPFPHSIIDDFTSLQLYNVVLIHCRASNSSDNWLDHMTACSNIQYISFPEFLGVASRKSLSGAEGGPSLVGEPYLALWRTISTTLAELVWPCWCTTRQSLSVTEIISIPPDIEEPVLLYVWQPCHPYVP